MERRIINLTALCRTSYVLVSVLFCLLLVACSGGEVKQDTEVIQTKSKIDRIDVDSDVEADFAQAVVLLQDAKYEQSIVLLKTVIEREKRSPAPFVDIAMAYTKIGDSKNAEENLINALKLDIGHPVANNELGLLYRKEGKFNSARVAYQNAIKEHPDYSPAIRNLGILCDIYMHDFACAAEQFEDYLKLTPDDKTVAIWLADVKSRLVK